MLLRHHRQQEQQLGPVRQCQCHSQEQPQELPWMRQAQTAQLQPQCQDSLCQTFTSSGVR
jgi:hypothetical protein